MFTEEELEEVEEGKYHLYCQTCDETITYNLAVYEEGSDGIYSTACPDCGDSLERIR